MIRILVLSLVLSLFGSKASYASEPCRRLLQKSDTIGFLQCMRQQWSSVTPVTLSEFCRSQWRITQIAKDTAWANQTKLEVESKFPKHGATRVLIAEDLWRTGDRVGAKALLGKVWGSFGKDQALAAFVAEVTFRQGDSATAITRLRSALRETPSSTVLRVTLAELLIASDRGSEALAELDAVLYYSPHEFHAAFLLARLHAHSLRPSDAEQQLKNILEQDPTYLIAYPLLFDVLLQQQKYQEAQMQFERYSNLGSPRLSEITQFIILLVASKQYTSAIAFGEVYADSFKTGDSYHKWMALSYAETGAHSKALASFQRCAEAQLKTEDWLKRAQSAIATGQFADAKKWLIHVLEKGEQDAVCYLLGELALREKSYSDAIRYYSRALALGGPSTKTNFGLGRAYYYKASYQEAFQSFLIMDSLLPGHSLPLLWLGRTMAAQDPESTKGLAKPYYTRLTELPLSRGDEQNKALIEAWSYLGYVYLLENKKSESIKAWEEVKKLDPVHPKAMEALNYLKP